MGDFKKYFITDNTDNNVWYHPKYVLMNDDRIDEWYVDNFNVVQDRKKDEEKEKQLQKMEW